MAHRSKNFVHKSIRAVRSMDKVRFKNQDRLHLEPTAYEEVPRSVTDFLRTALNKTATWSGGVNWLMP